MASNRSEGIILMASFISILMIPGIVINNATNTGLVNSSTSQTCAPLSQSPAPVCTLSTATGCQANSTFCSLNGQAISFLNSCSPFTNLLTLNFIGFISSFFSSCGTVVQQGSLRLNGANFGQLTSNPSQNTTFSTCTQTPSFHFTCMFIAPVVTGFTLNASVTCLNWNVIYGVVINPFTTIFNATSSFCSVQDASATPNQFTADCWLGRINATQPPQATCNDFLYSSTTTPSGTGATGIFGLFKNLATGNILGFFLSIIGAILIVLLGSGVNVGAATVTAGSNPQGTKQAQVFGVAMLIWGPLYSEFSTWFTSGFLPIGFDGVAGIASIVLIAGFFFGAYKLSQSGTPTS